MFDAVWAAALAINNTNSISLVNFMYNNKNAANISQYIYQEMVDLKFFGLSVSACTSWYMYISSVIYMCNSLVILCFLAHVCNLS